MGGLLSALVRSTLRPEDCDEIAARKRAWVLILLLAWACGPLDILNGLLAHNTMLMVTGAFVTLAASFVLGWFVASKSLGDWLPAMFMVAGCMAVSLYDLSVMPRGLRGWYFFVVVIDGLLALRAPQRYLIGSLCWVVAWMTLCAFEMCFRFGLLDLPLLLPYEDRVDHCEEPPCAVGLEGFVPAITAIMVFIGDYNATAGFCNALELEKEKMAATVTVTREIAGKLAKFDTTSAETTLDAAAASMPEELRGHLRQLIANLRAYRPYLPQSLLESEVCAASVCGRCSQTEEDILVPEPTVSVRSSPLEILDRSPSVEMFRDFCSDRATDPVAATSGASQGITIDTGSLVPPVPPAIKRAPVLALQRSQQLRTENVTLACFSAILPLSDVVDATQYVHLHTEYLGKVMANLKTCRGVLSRFVGESVYASFNAFRVAPTHPELGLTAATRHREMFPHSDYCSSAAVVSGRAYVGNLGTEQAQSPCVVGSLPVLLDEACRAGQALRVPFLCNYGTAWNVSAAFPLRIMLHRIVYPEEEEQRFGLALKDFSPNLNRGLLYTLLEGEKKGDRSSPGAGYEEWMYALESEPGKIWEQYNDAGVRYHGRGAEAAVRWLREKDAPEELVAKFERATVTAVSVTLSVQIEFDTHLDKSDSVMSVVSVKSTQ